MYYYCAELVAEERFAVLVAALDLLFVPETKICNMLAYVDIHRYTLLKNVDTIWLFV